MPQLEEDVNEPDEIDEDEEMIVEIPNELVETSTEPQPEDLGPQLEVKSLRNSRRSSIGGKSVFRNKRQTGMYLLLTGMLIVCM